MSKKASWVSRFSFYLLAVGSACGLGNIWRFPYVIGENGGGAFLLLYIFLAFTVGLSILVAELILGRSGEFSLLKITKLVSLQAKKPFYWFGRLSILINVVILAYYSVISGWVLHYLTQFIVGIVNENRIAYISSINMEALKNSGSLQFSLASVHLLICGFVVAKGVIERFEKIFAQALPILAVLFIVLIIRSFSLDSTSDVMRFLFYPDFSKLNLSSLGRALGHVFFTLSLGMGIMVTYGTYFKNDEHLPSVGFRVTTIDTIVSIMALLMVFPIAFLSDSNHYFTDPGILFESLPRLFVKIQYGEFFGFLFFLCLWLAAVNASIGLLETLIANFSDKFHKISRNQSTFMTITGVLLLMIFPAFSGTLFSKFKWFNQSFMENLDSLLINYLLPISGLGIIVIFFHLLNETERKEKFIDATGKNSQAMYRHWIWILKWFSPVLIGLAILLQFINLFR